MTFGRIPSENPVGTRPCISPEIPPGIRSRILAGMPSSILLRIHPLIAPEIFAMAPPGFPKGSSPEILPGFFQGFLQRFRFKSLLGFH